MKYQIREIKPDEYKLLNEFLYLSVFVPDGSPAPPQSIIEHPLLQVYIRDFGHQKDDTGLAAVAEGTVVGMVWARIMDDFGHVDDETPSIAISVRKEYRGMGIGTALLESMKDTLSKKGYEKTSLSVQKANYAADMYRKAGFVIAGENEEEFIMVCFLRKDRGNIGNQDSAK